METKVDIIIPIYNAYEDLQLCLASIKQYTDLSIHTLILINDNSPDKRIKPYLDQIVDTWIVDSSIQVIHNKENKGFSGNINLGMSVSNRDVILLNSDTVVTSNWVEKLLRCAYSDNRIATVTPLSNNATLCSVPNFCEENKIPKGMNIYDMASVVEEASYREYPEIPVAHGFCMLIKREVIKTIGNFDAAAFGRGYGEENDFCYRAIQAGYIHVICDDTFIYHKGTGSFISDEKMSYINKHNKILEQRYPIEMKNTHLHCMANPNKHIFDNVKNYIELWKNKKNILYLVRSDFREDASDNCGGTQLHVKDLTMAFRKEYNVFVLARDNEYLNLTIYTKEKSIFYRYYIGAKEAYPVFSNKILRELYSSILDVFCIEQIHIHHTDSLSLELFYVAEERKIPIITTLHDYYFICPNVKMLDCKNRLCIGKENQVTCEMCLKTNFQLSEQVDYLTLWRKKSKEVLQKSVQIVVPSKSAEEIISSYFPELKEKLCVIAHGSNAYNRREKEKFEQAQVVVTHNVKTYIEEMQIRKDGSFYIRGWTYEDGQDMKKCRIWIEIVDSLQQRKRFQGQKVIRDDVVQGDRNRRYSGINFCMPIQELAKGNLKVRVLIQKEKGEVVTNGESFQIWKEERYEKKKFHIAFIGGLSEAKGAKTAYELIKNSSKEIQWFIFGNIGYSKLRELKQRNLIKTGSYEREDLNNLLRNAQIDLVCILPIWPETFCYTLSEAILCKVPVLVTKIGALTERMEQLQCGWSVAVDASYKEILEVIETIRKDEVEYHRVKKWIEKLKLRNVEEMVKDYKKLYEKYRVSITEKRKEKKDFDRIKKSILNPEAALLENNQNKFCTEQFRILREKEEQLCQIENSVTYGVAKKLASIRFPGKMRIREVFYRLKNRR